MDNNSFRCEVVIIKTNKEVETDGEADIVLRRFPCSPAFFGKAHIAYIPDGHIVGLSKIPRIVDVFARRLQVQERLTEQILNCIDKTLKPQGVAVVIEASHMCMMMRGVQKQNSVTTTSGFRGAFKNMETRTEFLKLISQKLS